MVATGNTTRSKAKPIVVTGAATRLAITVDPIKDMNATPRAEMVEAMGIKVMGIKVMGIKVMGIIVRRIHGIVDTATTAKAIIAADLTVTIDTPMLNSHRKTKWR